MDDDDECPVCCAQAQFVCYERCGHAVCAECFERLRARRGECPVCRSRGNTGVVPIAWLRSACARRPRDTHDLERVARTLRALKSPACTECDVLRRVLLASNARHSRERTRFAKYVGVISRVAAGIDFLLVALLSGLVVYAGATAVAFG